MDEPGGNSYESAPTTIKISKELENCRCLNLCELHLILSDQMKLNSRRNQLAQQLIKKSYDYAMNFAQINGRQAIFDLRSSLEAHDYLKEFEIASLVNLIPRHPEEAKALIPTLGRLSDEQIMAVLGDIEKYKLFSP